jgi:hypothetical protein
LSFSHDLLPPVAAMLESDDARHNL